jgi:ABC-type Mn2+/Zn2+ transport system ATPase subunit
MRNRSPLPAGLRWLQPSALRYSSGVASTISLQRISKRFEAGGAGCRASVLAVREVSLEAGPGDRVGIVGRAGSGKSTVLLCAAGLLKPDCGSIRWFDRWSGVAPPHERIAYLDRTGRPGSRFGAGELHSVPRLYLFDDPLRAIDGAGYAVLARWLDLLCERGHCVIIASRESSAVEPLVSEIVELRCGARIEAPRAAGGGATRVRVAEVDTRFG